MFSSRFLSKNPLYPPPSLSLSIYLYAYIYIYAYPPHTHIYIYIYVSYRHYAERLFRTFLILPSVKTTQMSVTCQSCLHGCLCSVSLSSGFSWSIPLCSLPPSPPPLPAPLLTHSLSSPAPSFSSVQSEAPAIY